MGADPATLRHHLGFRVHEKLSADDLARAARHLGLQARRIRTGTSSLATTPLPALAFLNGDESGPARTVVLAQCDEHRVLLMDDAERRGRPLIQSIECFEARWTGELILVTSRASLQSALARFDFSWFIPSLVKYRRLFSEVLLISLMLQLFALVSPLFFQVVMDKVLVHKGVTTLDVLVIGLVVVVVFESLLSGLRAYVFSHTTNRIDVELGARLFRHLIQLPLAYFQARRVGDSVARMRELESIRSFLTGNALTVLLDVLFSGIFVAVMLFYSVPLTLIVLVSLPVYVAISLAVVPVLRTRLAAKFTRGAENQAMLVETIAGIQTLKASALEPAFARRWDMQLAGYIQESFKTQNLSTWAHEAVNQSIAGYKFHDVINAGAGNDSIEGRGGADRLYGGGGDDRISGGDGNDLIDGGAGSDFLNGDQGTDTYVFGRGSGHDRIYAAYGVRTDILQITDGVRPDEVSIRRENSSVVLTIIGTEDSIYIENELDNDGDTEWGVNEIRFADGTVWNIDTMRARFLEGNDSAQIIVGYKFDDMITAGAGNDSIHGQAGADRLFGGDGDDRINGGADNDLIDGGAGNDWLNGDQGTDTYVFGRGSGQDRIYSAYGIRTDILQIASGVQPDDLKVVRNGNDIILNIVETGDSLLIEKEMESDGETEWGVNEIRFSDGAVWNIETLRQLFIKGDESSQTLVGYKFDDLISGGGGDDLIQGQGGADAIYGGTGADFISGGDGNDGIDCGIGNDWMNGGQGTDTYVFGLGSGQDVIHAAYGVRTDILQISAELGPENVTLHRSGANLIVGVEGTNDSVRIDNELENDGDTDWGVESIRFFDGSVWNIDDIKSILLNPAAFHAGSAKLKADQTEATAMTQNLIQAMASFSPPAAGEVSYAANDPTNLQPLLAANWQ